MVELIVAVSFAVVISGMCSLFEAVLYSVPISHVESLAWVEGQLLAVEYSDDTYLRVVDPLTGAYTGIIGEMVTGFDGYFRGLGYDEDAGRLWATQIDGGSSHLIEVNPSTGDTSRASS